jgi:hypothetical protein
MLTEGLIVWLQKTSTTMTININIKMIMIKKIKNIKMKIMTNHDTLSLSYLDILSRRSISLTVLII